MQRSDSGEQQGAQNSNDVQLNATPSALLTAGRIQGLAGLVTQPSVGMLPTTSGVNLPTVTFTLPRTITAQSPGTQPLQLSAATLSNTRLVSPQAINIIQRQLSSGIVGLSTVSAQGLQVLQASGTPLTFVTATSPEAAAAFEQQRKARVVQQQRLKQAGTQNSSGSTIHHLAISSPANLVSNHSLSLTANMSGLQQPSTGLKRSQTAPGAVLVATSSTSSTGPIGGDIKLFTITQPLATANTSTTVTSARATTSPAIIGPPVKKFKLEEKPAPNKEIENYRQCVSSHKQQKMLEIKTRYREHLTELFYLQGGGNITEFHTWKKRPSQPLLSFLEGSKLDDDDDEELQEKRINDEVKVLTSAGSNVPLATPVAISTTLPPSVSALSQQGSSESLASFPSFTTNTNPTLLGSHASGIDEFLRQLTAYVKGIAGLYNFGTADCDNHCFLICSFVVVVVNTPGI